MVRASSAAWSARFMNAPVPTLTSSTSASVPSAIFLLMIDAAIIGIDSTVPVTSRSAYSLRSAGRQIGRRRTDHGTDRGQLGRHLLPG